MIRKIAAGGLEEVPYWEGRLQKHLPGPFSLLAYRDQDIALGCDYSTLPACHHAACHDGLNLCGVKQTPS